MVEVLWVQALWMTLLDMHMIQAVVRFGLSRDSNIEMVEVRVLI